MAIAETIFNVIAACFYAVPDDRPTILMINISLCILEEGVNVFV